MATFTSEEDYLDSVKPSKFTSMEDYEMPKDDARLNTVRGMGAGQQAIDAAAYQQRRMTNSMKQAWHMLRGNTQDVKDLQKIMDHEDKIYKKYLRSEYNPHRTAAAAGSLGGAITHPVSMATMPLGGGATLPTRAAIQGLYGAGVEALTSPGDLGDRTVAGATGFAGGAVGSAGSDVVMKGLSGIRGKWTDPVARKADELSKEFGLEPGVGQLREYSGRQMTPDQLKARGSNWPYAIEKHATHNQEVGARKLKASLGHNPDSAISTARPKVDAKDLGEELTKEAEAIWKPFNKAADNSKHMVRPDKLWGKLKEIGKHNSKILNDSSAIPDDEVRMQLKDIIDTEEWTRLPKFTPKQYSKIVGELSNAQNRLSVLSKSDTLPYDGTSVARMTEAFGSAKNDMAKWGKKDPSGFATWEKALTDYQEKILPVKNNPVFQTSRDLNPKGRDLANLMDTTSDGTQYDLMRDLLKEYKSRGMDDAANRLDLLDINSLATAHGASGATAIATGIPKIPKGNDPLAFLGDSYTSLANRPSVKGLYFGDPKIPKLGSSTSGLGMIKDAAEYTGESIARRSPIAASREMGAEELAVLKMLYDLMPWAGEDEDQNSNDPNFSHGVGAATQSGVMGR